MKCNIQIIAFVKCVCLYTTEEIFFIIEIIEFLMLLKIVKVDAFVMRLPIHS